MLQHFAIAIVQVQVIDQKKYVDGSKNLPNETFQNIYFLYQAKKLLKH